jgi:hypothetical protein
MYERFHRHIDEVSAAIPAERLLIYQVAEGWAPLCKFLGLDIPETAFPQVNSTEEFKAMIAARGAQDSFADAH